MIDPEMADPETTGSETTEPKMTDPETAGPETTGPSGDSLGDSAPAGEPVSTSEDTSTNLLRDPVFEMSGFKRGWTPEQAK
jgi:hypothetical protein